MVGRRLCALRPAGAAAEAEAQAGPGPGLPPGKSGLLGSVLFVRPDPGARPTHFPGCEQVRLSKGWEALTLYRLHHL